MSSSLCDLVVVGAGPAGLAAAWAARQRGWSPVIVDRGSQVGGAWARMPAETRCLSPRRHDRFADGTSPPGDTTRASAAEVLAGVTAFAARAAFDVRLDVEVLRVRSNEDRFVVETSAGVLVARSLIVASGEYERPYVPTLPGRFDGLSAHTRVFRPDEVREGERVVVVGAGNSAAQVVAALVSRGARVAVSMRAPLGRLPLLGGGDGPLQALAHLLSAAPVRLLPGRGGCRETTPLVEETLHAAARRNLIVMVDETIALAGDGVLTASGRHVPADRLVWATGYRRDTACLAGLVALDERGRPGERDGRSVERARLGFVGLPCQRTRRSGFLRGFVDDAVAVVKALQ